MKKTMLVAVLLLSLAGMAPAKDKEASKDQQIEILKAQLRFVNSENQRLTKLIQFLSQQQGIEQKAAQEVIDRVQKEVGCTLTNEFKCMEEVKEDKK